VVLVGSAHQGKGSLVGVLGRDLLESRISAADLIQGAAAELGGGGSRDPELAQAGGPRGERLDAALALARENAEAVLGSL
jgi:alanyl-tRNA synthetase